MESWSSPAMALPPSMPCKCGSIRPKAASMEAFYRRNAGEPLLRLSPFTRDDAVARDRLNASGGAIDGVVAKRLDGVYEPGKRAMIKVKRLRTADCVVGGFRYLERER